MRIRNDSNGVLLISDIPSIQGGLSLTLNVGAEELIYNEDAEKSHQLGTFIDAGLITVLSNTEEPSSGESQAQAAGALVGANQVEIVNAPTAGQVLQSIDDVSAQWVTGGGGGTQGPQGAQGGAGSQGNQGTAGSGSQGDQGAGGAQGADGAQGGAGSQGDQGGDGSQGDQGGAGSQGDQGGAGSQGNQGSQGEQGSAGSGPDIKMFQTPASATLGEHVYAAQLTGLASLPQSVFGLGGDYFVVGYQETDSLGNIGAIMDPTDMSVVTQLTPGSSGYSQIQNVITGRLGSNPALFLVDGTKVSTINTGTGVVSATPLFDVAGFTYGSDTLQSVVGMSALDDSRKVIWVWGRVTGGADSFIATVDVDSPTDFVVGSYKKFTGVTNDMMATALPSSVGVARLALAMDNAGWTLNVYDETGASIASQAYANTIALNPVWDGTNLMFFADMGRILITDAGLSTFTYRETYSSSQTRANLSGSNLIATGMFVPSLYGIGWDSSAGRKFYALGGMPIGIIVGNFLICTDMSSAKYIVRADLTTLV